ncbi:molecular chaperone [Pseudomonas sp. Marseille-QA0892]
MDEPTPYLRNAAPDLTALSFSNATPEALGDWLGSLPRQQIGPFAQKLYQSLIELNRLQAPASVRFYLLERLRPEVQLACRQLDQWIARGGVLDERARKAMTLAQGLQTHLASGYKRIATQPRAPERPSDLEATACQRTLRVLLGPLLRTAGLYTQAPSGLWVEAHSLYQWAHQQGLHQTTITDAQHGGSAQTIEQAYLTLLLLGCARTNQLRPGAIIALAAWLEEHAHLAGLNPLKPSGARLVVSLEQDAPPREPSLHASYCPTDLALDPHRLLTALGHAQVRSGPTGLTPDVVGHLQRTWGDNPVRTFNRTPAQGSLRCCIGMTAIHTLLADGEDFASQLRKSSTSRTARYRLDNEEPDVWASVLNTESPTDWLGLPSQEVQYPRDDASDATLDDDVILHEPHIVNHSPGGYCLRWPGDAPPNLQVGELLAIDDRRQGWGIAVVRWLNRRTADTRIGVEMIAPQARPCGLRMIYKVRQDVDYVRGLLLPEIKALARPAMLITPRLPFHEGCKATVNLQGEERRALLREQQGVTASFGQFTFEWLQSLPESAAQVKTDLDYDPGRPIQPPASLRF